MKVLVEKEFELHERRDHEECDSPVIGASEHRNVYKIKHGSFKTKGEAKTHKDALIEQFALGGWSVSRNSSIEGDTTALYNSNCTDDIVIWIEERIISEKIVTT